MLQHRIERATAGSRGVPAHVDERMRRALARLDAHPTCELCRQQRSIVVQSGRAACGKCGGTCRAAAAGARALDELRRQLDVELRELEASRCLIGYAHAWHTRRRRTDGYTESFAPGAFRRCLAAGREIFALVNHDHDRVIGSTGDGSLRLRATAHGLGFELEPRNTPDGDTVLAAAAVGAVRGVSIGKGRVSKRFMTVSQHRTIEDADIYEISIVLAPEFPGFPSTWAGLRTAANVMRWHELDLDALDRELADCDDL